MMIRRKYPQGSQSRYFIVFSEISQENYRAALSQLSKSFTAKGKSAPNDSRTSKLDRIKNLLKSCCQWICFQKIGMPVNFGYALLYRHLREHTNVISTAMIRLHCLRKSSLRVHEKTITSRLYLLQVFSSSSRICWSVLETDVIGRITNWSSKASGTYGNPRVSLLEFDKRFDVFEEFVHYDFQKPLNLPGEHQNANLSLFWAFNYQFSRDEREIWQNNLRPAVP